MLICIRYEDHVQMIVHTITALSLAYPLVFDTKPQDDVQRLQSRVIDQQHSDRVYRCSSPASVASQLLFQQ